MLDQNIYPSFIIGSCQFPSTYSWVAIAVDELARPLSKINGSDPINHFAKPPVLLMSVSSHQ